MYPDSSTPDLMAVASLLGVVTLVLVVLAPLAAQGSVTAPPTGHDVARSTIADDARPAADDSRRSTTATPTGTARASPESLGATQETVEVATAAIGGRVTDESGQPVDGAVVWVDRVDLAGGLALLAEPDDPADPDSFALTLVDDTGSTLAEAVVDAAILAAGGPGYDLADFGALRANRPLSLWTTTGGDAPAGTYVLPRVPASNTTVLTTYRVAAARDAAGEEFRGWDRAVGAARGATGTANVVLLGPTTREPPTPDGADGTVDLATGALAGRVTDGAGRPVDGAVVWVDRVDLASDLTLFAEPDDPTAPGTFTLTLVDRTGAVLNETTVDAAILAAGAPGYDFADFEALNADRGMALWTTTGGDAAGTYALPSLPAVDATTRRTTYRVAAARDAGGERQRGDTPPVRASLFATGTANVVLLGPTAREPPTPDGADGTVDLATGALAGRVTDGAGRPVDGAVVWVDRVDLAGGLALLAEPDDPADPDSFTLALVDRTGAVMTEATVDAAALAAAGPGYDFADFEALHADRGMALWTTIGGDAAGTYALARVPAANSSVTATTYRVVGARGGGGELLGGFASSLQSARHRTAAARVVVERVAASSFAVTDLSAPEEIGPGETAELVATVSNAGDYPDEQTVEFRIDANGDGDLDDAGDVAARTDLDLDPGAETVVRFQVTVPDEPGSYAVGVFTDDEDATGDVAVVDDPAGSTATPTATEPGGSPTPSPDGDSTPPGEANRPDESGDGVPIPDPAAVDGPVGLLAVVLALLAAALLGLWAGRW